MASKRARRAAEARKANKKKKGASSQQNGEVELEADYSRSTAEYRVNEKVYPVEKEDELLSEDPGLVANHKRKDVTNLSSKTNQTFIQLEAKQNRDDLLDVTASKTVDIASKAPYSQKKHIESRNLNSSVTPAVVKAYISGNGADYNKESCFFVNEKNAFMSHNAFLTNCNFDTKWKVLLCDQENNLKSSSKLHQEQVGAIPLSSNYSVSAVANEKSLKEHCSKQVEPSGTTVKHPTHTVEQPVVEVDNSKISDQQSLLFENSTNEKAAVKSSDRSSHSKAIRSTIDVNQSQNNEKANPTNTQQDLAVGLVNRIEQQSKWWHCCGLLDLLLQRS